MKKRILACVLATVTAFAVFGVGCGNQENPPVTNESSTAFNYTTGVDLNGAPLNVVENGQSKYVIAIPDNASKMVIEGADELNNYIALVTGVRLNTQKESTLTEGQKYISVGNTNLFSQTGLDVKTLTYDGFYIKTVGENIYISANQDIGVKFGVYSFIERFLGVRWLTDTYTHIPTSDKMVVHPCDIKEEPQFEMRTWYGGATVIGGKKYQDHLRFNLAEDLWCKDVSSTHNATDSAKQPGIGYVNKSDVDPYDAQGRTLGVTHPEYFSDYTNKASSEYDLCYTNGVDENGKLKEGPSVTRHIIEKMKGFLEKDAEEQAIKYFMVGLVDDRQASCHCETCKARKELYTEAGIYVMFMNVINEHVNSWLQDAQNRTAKFVMFAYHQTYLPPVKEVNGKYEPLSPLVIANENLYIRLAPIDADYTYSFVDDRQDQTVKLAIYGWMACAKNFMIWDYQSNYIEYYWYFPTTHYLKENLKFYKEIGTVYIMNQSSYTQNNVPLDDLRSYVSSRLYWNFDWDVNYLINEYLTLYYGEGASTVKEFIDLFDGFYANVREQGKLDVSLLSEKSSFIGGEINTISLLNKAIRILEDGEAKVRASETISQGEKERIANAFEILKLTPMRMILRNYTSYYSEDTKLEFAKKFFAICDKYRITALGETGIRSVATRKQECGLA